ncbi:hypothetical protein C8Q74DRAFT_1258417 [Fomes fomentarius]|nr:hypothetical protein C8Q74DRAFT_1258417 [Fomes fomentarius]
MTPNQPSPSMSMGGPQPYAVRQFRECCPVPQLVCARVDGKPNPVPLLPQIRFAAGGLQGVSMGELLQCPKDILRTRISGFEDQRILEVLFSHIELKIYWPGYSNEDFTHRMYLSEQGGGGVSCHGELAIEVARGYEKFLKEAPRFMHCGHGAEPLWRITSDTGYTVDKIALLAVNHRFDNIFQADVQLIRWTPVPVMSPLHMHGFTALPPSPCVQAPQTMLQVPPATFQAPPATLQTPVTILQGPHADIQDPPAIYQDPGPQAVVQAHEGVFQVPQGFTEATATPSHIQSFQTSALAPTAHTETATRVTDRAYRAGPLSMAPGPLSASRFGQGNMLPYGGTPYVSQIRYDEPFETETATTDPPTYVTAPMMRVYAPRFEHSEWLHDENLWKGMTISDEQKGILLSAFSESKYVMASRKHLLAQVLGVKETTVANWFARARQILRLQQQGQLAT